MYRRSLKAWVYFIRSADPVGHIKIGCSSRPMLRVDALKGWSPFALTVEAEIEGDESLERRFHALLIEHRVRSEWFRATPEVNAIVDAVAAGSFDISTLPEGVDMRQSGGPRGDGFSGLSGSISMRLTHLRKRGVSVPKSIQDAADRFSNNPYRVGWGHPRPLSDGAEVVAWLADHSPVPPHLASLLPDPSPNRKAA